MAAENYRAALVADDGAFALLRGEWNGLLLGSASHSVFLTWEWLYYWWRHFGGGDRSLHVVTLRRAKDNSLAGIAPLFLDTARTAAGYRAGILRFLGSDRVGSDFLEFIAAPGEEDAVLDAAGRFLAESCRTWDGIELSDMNGGSPTPARLRAWFRRKRYPVIVTRRSVCPFLRLPGRYEEFVESLGDGLRAELKRKTRHGEGQGRFMYSIEECPVDMAARISEIFTLHRNSFQIKRYGDIESAFEGEELERFHGEVSGELSRQGWLRIYRITSAGSPVALLYGFRFKGRLFCYQTGFDVEWRRYSPGMVLLGYAINDCIMDGIREFHFLRGNESYKARWTADAVRTVRMTVVRPDLRGFGYAASAGMKTGIRRIKRLVLGGEKAL